MLCLSVLFAEVLNLKFYTGYVDGWLERMGLQMKEKDPVDEAEKGLLKEDGLHEKEREEKKADFTPEEMAIVMDEKHH